ncbi:MAG: type II secretion system F family protein [Planctomycetaceae bacterium]
MGYLFSRLFAAVQLLLWGWLRGEFGLVLVRVLRTTVDRGLPAAPLVESLSDGAPFAWRRRWHLLAQSLQAGVPIAQAVQSVPRALPPDALLLVLVGDHLGNVGAGLKRAEEGLVQQTANRLAQPGGVLLRVLLWIPTLVVCLFIFISVLPRVTAVFQGYGVALPATTRGLLTLADWVVSHGVAFLLLTALGLWLLGELVTWMVRWPAGLAGMGWPRWLRWGNRRRSPPVLLRTVALAVDSGRPVAEALGWLARLLPGQRESRHLARVEGELLDGAPLWPTLRKAGLVSAVEEQWFDSAQRAGNLSHALSLAACESERRHAARAHWIAQLTETGLVLLTGALVLGVMLALWLPLVQLMELLS